MSDDTDQELDLTPEILAHFRELDFRCSVCHQNHFANVMPPPINDQSELPSLAVMGPGGRAPTSRVPLFFLVCQTCSHVIPFAYPYLKDILLQKRRKHDG